MTLRAVNNYTLRCLLVSICLLVATAAFLIVAFPGYAQQKIVNISNGAVKSVTVTPGRTLTIKTNVEFSNLVIGNPDVADVVPLSARSLYVQGNRSGFTNISAYDEDNNLLGIIDVRVRRDFTELSESIRSAVPSARVTVSHANNQVRLSGMVKDAVDLDRVLEIAQQYAGEEPVINSIRIMDSQQVELQVRVLEVARNNGRDLGINLAGVKAGNVKFITGNDYGVETRTTDPIGLVPNYNNNPTVNGSPFGTAISKLLELSGTQIDIVINALEAKGAGRRLANPRMIVQSGEYGNFLVGGEIPIAEAVQGENGSVATGTSYREYGVRLQVRPIVLDDGLVNLEIEPEVSDVDFGRLVNGSPTFITRKASTTVQLRDGQSFSIAGLLQTTNDRNIEQLPWLGQIPVLGALFRSTSFQKKETDLVIVVTPRIVRPAAPDEPLQSPLDQTRSTDDVELFLLGMLEVDKDMLRRFHAGEGIVGPYGHRLDLEFPEDYYAKK